ncbi:hypothetical protein SDC9_180933 [bioreactor metagenome]|uniref:Uncharacterized protein n=1 Tax=bioreactor metagenome TaxID=1076179 RepID=A0A645H333_9ZZZZ
MRQKKRNIPEPDPERGEQQQQGYAGNDIRVEKRQVRYVHHRVSDPLPGIIDADGGGGSDHHGDQGGQKRQRHRCGNGLHDGPVLKERLIPLERKPAPIPSGFGMVERIQDQNADGQV